MTPSYLLGFHYDAMLLFPCQGQVEASAAERTPNLGALLTEVFARADWRSGNAVSLVFTPTNTTNTGATRATLTKNTMIIAGNRKALPSWRVS